MTSADPPTLASGARRCAVLVAVLLAALATAYLCGVFPSVPPSAGGWSADVITRFCPSSARLCIWRI
ncbi:hypothetical protein SAMN05216298_2621 [Glycomyces sambucus]|uniref:Uncharacterized protein n=1 Tax=Glycomyces sambucus TaxID=380244 RepID=A0A1G9H523_9ACTN|nr:hypothetical protein [Glycomyces sambucus]SDL07975.1 hypothetical protein SAMN05216298_2621 [Glycomyces sambucus]